MSSFAPSRPSTPPTAVEDVSIVLEQRQRTPPQRSDSRSSSDSNGSRSSSKSRRAKLAQATNTLILTPLPPAFFQDRVMAAIRQHFASFSTTFVHKSSGSIPTHGPGSPSQPQPLDGDLYSFVPLRSLKRAIVVFYEPADAERARDATDHLYFPATANSPAVTLRCFRGANTPLIPADPYLIKRDYGRFYDVDSDDESAVYESPFHLRPPVPEKNFLISPPGSPPVGWEQTIEEPPNEIPLAEDLQRALERLQLLRQAEEGGEDVENEDGILLIPENETGVSVRVQNWSHRRRSPPLQKPADVRMFGDDWDELDEELSDLEIEWEPAPIRGTAGWKQGSGAGIKPLPASMPAIIAPPQVSAPFHQDTNQPGVGSGLGGGLMSPAGNARIQPTARPPVH